MALLCLCAVIEKWMTPFQPEKMHENTRRCLVFPPPYAFSLLKWRHSCFYHSTQTQVPCSIYLFYKITSVFRKKKHTQFYSVKTSSVSLGTLIQNENDVKCTFLYTLRENDVKCTFLYTLRENDVKCIILYTLLRSYVRHLILSNCMEIIERSRHYTPILKSMENLHFNLLKKVS